MGNAQTGYEGGEIGGYGLGGDFGETPLGQNESGWGGYDDSWEGVSNSIMDVIGTGADRGMSPVGNMASDAMYARFNALSIWGKITEIIGKSTSVTGFLKGVKDKFSDYDSAAKSLVATGVFPTESVAKDFLGKMEAENRAAISGNVQDIGRGNGNFEDIVLTALQESTGTSNSGTMTPQEKAKKEAQAYIDSDPAVKAAYNAAVASNPGWANNMEKWAQGNFQQRQSQGQQVTWPTVGEDGTVTTAATPTGPAAGSLEAAWGTYNPGMQNPYSTQPANALAPGGQTGATTGATPAQGAGGLPNNGINSMDPATLTRYENQTSTGANMNALSPTYGTGVMQPSTDIYKQSTGDVNQTMTQGRADIDAGVNQMVQEFTAAENKAEAALKQALATGRGDINAALAQVTEEMRPYDIAGKKALENVMGMLQAGVPSMEEFRKSRTYQSPLEDMSQNMQRLAAVKGQFLDPSTIMAINQKAQDYGSQRWQEFQDNEYWKPLEANMNVAQNIGMPASGRIADASQWAGGTKAQMEANTGANLAQNAQWGGAGRAGAQQWGAGAKTDLGTWGSGQKTGVGQNYISNMLNKGNQGIQWYNAGEGQKERDWTENVGIPFAREQGQVAMDYANRMNTKNQQNSIWNSVIGGAGSILGGWLS